MKNSSFQKIACGIFLVLECFFGFPAFASINNEIYLSPSKEISQLADSTSIKRHYRKSLLESPSPSSEERELILNSGFGIGTYIKASAVGAAIGPILLWVFTI